LNTSNTSNTHGRPPDLPEKSHDEPKQEALATEHEENLTFTMTHNPNKRLFPPLSPDRRAALKQSIVEHGVNTPAIVDEDGGVVDGFERVSICQELGQDCPTIQRTFAGKWEKMEVALDQNCARRQLGRQQKHELIRACLLRDPTISDNGLASKIGGVSKNKVKEVRDELIAACLIDNVEKRRGADGKRYPAKRVVVNTAKEVEAVSKIIRDLPDSCNGKLIDVTTASRRARAHHRREIRQGQVIQPLPDDAIKLYHCPFQKLEKTANIAANSAHLLLTDIVYGKAFLGELAELAPLAQRILVDKGLFVTYCGQYDLDEVLAILGRSLTYRWVAASVWSSGANRIFPLNLRSNWKPIVIFSKGDWRERSRWGDLFHSKREKDWHDWQQSLADAESLVEHFSRPGDLVVDPCAGSFTNAVACRNLSRRFFGCDKDEQAVLKGQARLAAGNAFTSQPTNNNPELSNPRHSCPK